MTRMKSAETSLPKGTGEQDPGCLSLRLRVIAAAVPKRRANVPRTVAYTQRGPYTCEAAGRLSFPRRDHRPAYASPRRYPMHPTCRGWSADGLSLFRPVALAPFRNLRAGQWDDDAGNPQCQRWDGVANVGRTTLEHLILDQALSTGRSAAARLPDCPRR